MLQASNSNSPKASFHPLAASSSTSSIHKLSSINSGQETGRIRNKTRATIVAQKEVDLSHDEIQLDVDDNYFQPDTEKDIVTDDPQAISAMCRRCRERENQNAYETYFKLKVFIQFLLMHFLFFFALGPFIFITIPIFGPHVLRNQQFIGWNRGWVIQVVQYFAFAGFLFAYYYTDTPGLQAIEIYMICIAILIRFIAIASKYAYRSERFIKLLYTKTLSLQDLRGDLLLAGWRDQVDSVIEEEVQAAILRLEVDSSLFFFSFLNPPEPNLYEKLCKPFKKKTESPVKKSTFEQRNMSFAKEPLPLPIIEDTDRDVLRRREISSETVTPRETTQIEELNKDLEKKELKKAKSKFAKKETIIEMTKNAYEVAQSFSYYLDAKKVEEGHLYGYNLAIDMFQNARKSRYRHLGKSLWIFSIIRAFIPTFYRVYLRSYKGEDIPVLTERPYVVLIVLLINIYLCWINIFTLTVAILDFSAKIFCFKQLGYLISPKKISHFRDKKLYPTFNIFDPVTLKTWSTLRRVIKEYGRKYILRNNFNVTITMMFYLIIVAMVVLQVLGVVDTYNDPLMMIVFAYESVMFFAIFISIMLAVAFINSQYMTDKSLLQKNKTIISDFQRLSYLYVGKDAIEPDNMVYKEGLRILREQLGEEDFEEKLIARAEKLTSMIDNIIQELEFEEAYDPSTVMGIPVSYGLLKTLAAAIASVIFAVGQSFASK